MKRHRRTALLLTIGLTAPLLVSGMVYRRRTTESIFKTIQPRQASTADLDEIRNRPDDVPLPVSIETTPIHFEVYKVENRKSIIELESRLGAVAFIAMLKINRTDRKHIRVGDSLIIPDPGADAMSFAPFPLQIEAARSIPKLVLVSRRVQAFGAYESGRLVQWGPTSTGKKSTPTPAGLYHANWKAKTRRSSINQSWILPWCFNLDDSSGISFHQFDLPGYPASHGCVRLLEEDAMWVYEWADQWTLSKVDHAILSFGTPVLIFGDYSYGEKPVWKRLVEDHAAAVISVAETEGALNKHLATIAIKAPAPRPANAGRQIPVVAAISN